MIQLSSVMWACAIFFAVIGFLRGWNKELVATAGILLGIFALFQFDGLLRGTVFLIMPRDQVFLVQAGAFIAIVFIVYQARDIGITSSRRSNSQLQTGLLGALVGFVNGYLIGGSLWYLLDINEYPIPEYVTAPAINSPSAQALNTMPLVLIGGGASGTGDMLAVLVILLLFVVLVIA